MRTYPVMLILKDKECVVIGGGKVAERKVRSMLDTGAAITVVSPECTTAIELWAKSGLISLIPRAFVPQDIENASIVIAATSSAEINLSVYHAADRRQWINVVDRPDLCSFYVPAVLDQGDLQIAVSTGGKSPGLAQKLKEELKQLFGEEYADYVDFLGQMRAAVLSVPMDASRKKAVLAELLSPEFYQLTKEGRITERTELAEKLIRSALS